MESRKRKLPPRAAARGEGAAKKRTPSVPRAESPQPVSDPLPVVDEAPPKSTVTVKPLPTTEDAQPPDLPATQFQSIAESGGMAESLDKSRKKWLSEGVFERYWTKPKTGKKKSNTLDDPAPNNPPKDSMTKLGSCTITIEPHVFDTIMYVVKDPTPRPPPNLAAHQTMYRPPIIQYGPPNGAIPYAQMPPPREQPIPAQTVPHGSPSVNNKPIKAASDASPNIAQHSNGFELSQSSSIPPTPNPRPSTQNPPPAMPPSPAPAPAPPSKSSDPVIQMLAERAATDESLKSLMRIVADGKATTSELKQFQAHIDELTKLLHARQTAIHTNSTSSTQLPAQPPAAPGARHPPPPVAGARSTYPQQSNGHHSVPQPQALRSKGPLPPSKPDISAVVFEFVGGSGDRFLFPKYSILDYHPGGYVIASFLIVRKGSSADSKSYDPQLDYYQPVTIRLYTHQARQLDSLSKVVAPADEVRKYMDDIMDNMTRAEYVLLATPRPRESEPAKIETLDVMMGNNGVENQVLWNTTVNSFPKPKAVKKSLSEEEQYRNFIASVS